MMPVASLAQITFIRSEKKNIIKANQVGLLSCSSPEGEGKVMTEGSEVSWVKLTWGCGDHTVGTGTL